NTSTHAVALAPLQWSAPSSSQESPFAEPVQLAVATLKPSAGQALAVPVQLSATSHWPAESRQVVVAGRNTSTHAVALAPLQWSAPSSSQESPFAEPVQLAVATLKPSAGQALVVPVQLSATSHWPADSLHVVVAGWNTSTHAVALAPLQWSA